MRKLFKFLAVITAIGLVALAAAYFFVLPQLGRPATARDLSGLKGDAVRGRYLVIAGGCIACHTDIKNKAKILSGGPALKTPFGIFFAPNITPDKIHGIGSWTLAQFARAMTSGISPQGKHYFPSFPYTSYTAMAAQDLADLKSYLDTVAPVAKPAKPHAVSWPFSDRRLIGAWKQLYFQGGQFKPITDKSQTWNRGAYLVNVLGHCGECHTQRDILGGTVGKKHAGNSRGPDGSRVPKLRGLRTKAGERWTRDELTMSLLVGMKPSGDFLGDVMAEVVAHSTRKLTPDDQAAIAEYLLSLGD